MAARKDSKVRGKARGAANDDDFYLVDAKRAALEAAERQARRKPARVVEPRSRASSVLARPQPTRGRSTSVTRSTGGTVKGTARKATARKSAQASTAASVRSARSARKSAASKKGNAARTRQPDAKRVSGKLRQLAERKSARRAQKPAWQTIEHHDHREQVNAPPVRSARIASGRRGDRRLTPAEKQRAGE